ncbi:hypothetical protein MTR_3g073700 [Medicago truncatula]|uniref:Uncharacterized protein n=1 Tax=Medicago truncatula TaxID=3880 RepID=A0A072V0J8_MEDTR|nr:hypothetical protein MTR_3g073700 [Medicago truncatula]
MSRATFSTLLARFPDSESTLKRPHVRLSVQVPVANLHVRYQHAFGLLQIGLGIGQAKPGFDRPEPGLRKILQA